MSQLRVLSASQVDTFRQCSLKWRFRHVDRLAEDSRAAALVIGSVVDVAVKTAIHAIRSGGAKPTDLSADELFRTAWDGELATSKAVAWGERGEDKAAQTAKSLVGAFLALPGLSQRVAGITDIDLRFELPVLHPDSGQEVPGLRIQGILDLVERDASGHLRPLEIKTSASRAGYDPESLTVHLQGALYVDALRRLRPAEATDGMAFLVGLKLKEALWEEHVTVLDASARRRAIRTVLAARRGMDLGLTFPQPSFFCPTCPYLAPCRRWQDGPLTEIPSDPFAR